VNSEHLAALRQAAAALISTAAAPAVLATLRTLLADPEFAWETPEMAARPAPSPPRSPAPRPPPRYSTEWDALRVRVRATKAVRQVNNTVVAAELGVAYTTLDSALRGRRRPSRALQERLKTWVSREPAPEVAAPAAPFRPNGTSRIHSDTDAGFSIAAADRNV
jgi:hypothetical protein